MLHILVPFCAAIASLHPPSPKKFSEVQLFQWSNSQWHPTDAPTDACLVSGWAGWDTLKQLCRWPWLCNAVSVTYWKIIIFVFLLVLLIFLSESKNCFVASVVLLIVIVREWVCEEKSTVCTCSPVTVHSSAWERLKDRTELWCSLISPLVTGKTNADALKSKRKPKPHHFYPMSWLEIILGEEGRGKKKKLEIL